jgi:hypothetical protein
MVLAAVLCGGSLVSAHEARRVGPLTIEIGWIDEPPLAGFENGIEVGIERGGAALRTADLQVQVIFGPQGSANASQPLPLQPVFDAPGEFTTFAIPTRPGTYSFRLTGTAGGVAIDESFTSGPNTFDDVRSSGGFEVPVADPSRGELAERLERLDARVGEAGGGVMPLAFSVLAAVIAMAALVVALRRQRG